MTPEQARRGDRPQAIFEDFPNAPRPPLPELQSPWDAGVPGRFGLRDRLLVRGALRAGFLVSGFGAFHRRLAGRAEEFLARGGDVPAPAPRHSAVQALADQPGVDPLLRGASLLAALWDFHAEIRSGRFRPESPRGQALESRPYLNLMGSSILFEGDSFRQVKTPCTSRFLAVARRRIHVVDLDVDGEGPSVGSLRSALEQVWARSGTPDAPPVEKAPGMLTCAPAATQAAAFRVLSQDPAGREALEMVRDSFVTICLELDRFPETDAEAAMWALSGDFGNRWFYSCLQIVVFGNGKACQISNPNCFVTGNIMMRIAAELNRRGAALAAAASDAAGPVSIAEPRWNLEAVSFEPVMAGLAGLRDDQQATFDLAGFGRTALENAGLRPVEFFVIALQHATYRLAGRLPSVRQMVATEQFRCGMLATALVSTPEMAALQEALRDPGAAPSALRALYSAAVESQRSVCRAERSTVGVERQLGWFMSDLGGIRRRYARAVMDAVWSVAGKPERARSDILISHPAIMEDVPVVGRPGVRLPYVGCFGMHYQILGDRIRLTLMPATSWNVPNERLVAELAASLRELAGRLGARGPGERSPAAHGTCPLTNP